MDLDPLQKKLSKYISCNDYRKFNIEEEVKNLSLKHVLFGTLLAFLIKSLVKGADLSEVLIVAVLSSLIALYELQLNYKKESKLQEQINNLIEHNKEQDKYIDDLKSSIVSVKVSSGIRGLTNK